MNVAIWRKYYCVGHEILEAVEDGYVEEAVGEVVPYLAHNQYFVDLFVDVLKQCYCWMND